MNLSLTDIVCALVILMCGGGLLYLLNPDFEHFITTEIQPSAAEWGEKNLPIWDDVRTQFMEGYNDGKSHPNRQK
jgi:hypothetical protein